MNEVIHRQDNPLLVSKDRQRESYLLSICLSICAPA